MKGGSTQGVHESTGKMGRLAETVQAARKLLSVLGWRVRFTLIGHKRLYWSLLGGWRWSGECWRDWDDARWGLADPRDAAREECQTARLEGRQG